MRRAVDEIIQLPDLIFVQWCEGQFGVNRGVEKGKKIVFGHGRLSACLNGYWDEHLERQVKVAKIV